MLNVNMIFHHYCHAFPGLLAQEVSDQPSRVCCLLHT